MRPSGPGMFLSLVGALLASFALAHAEPVTLSVTVEFDRSEVTLERAGDYEAVRMQDAVPGLDVGFPELPLRLVTIALPEGTVAVGADAEVLARTRLPGTHTVRPVQPQVPLSRPGVARQAAPDPAAYASAAPYPSETCTLLGNGPLGGIPVATVAVHPVQYVAADGALTLNETVRIDLTLEASLRSTVRHPADDRASVERLRALVVNPEAVASDGGRPQVRTGAAEYLIITSSSLASIFQPLADWKTTKGIPAQILTTDWIYANYTGVDNQDRIRNCIIDYYENHATTWVLLGGDTGVVPARITYAMTTGEGTPGEDDLQCDLYYAGLDGSVR